MGTFSYKIYNNHTNKWVTNIVIIFCPLLFIIYVNIIRNCKSSSFFRHIYDKRSSVHPPETGCVIYIIYIYIIRRQAVVFILGTLINQLISIPASSEFVSNSSLFSRIWIRSSPTPLLKLINRIFIFKAGTRIISRGVSASGV